MSKVKKISAVSGCAAVAAVAAAGVWKIYIRKASEKVNLITTDTSVVPEPVVEMAEEGYVQLSEVKMHYCIYGDGGYPLILIHGNGGNCNSLREAAQYLANDYRVYVTESRCHGKSSNTEEISYDLMAKDIKEFCDALNIEKPYIMGHSDGGINALTVAYTYPDLPRAVISCGANTTPDTFKPYFTAGVKLYDIIKPSKLNDMMLTLPQMNATLLSQITCPTYIVAGENDIMWLSDTVFIHKSIKNSSVAIIRGANHSSYISHDGKQAYIIAKNYFDSL